MMQLKEFCSQYISYIGRFWTNLAVSSILGISVGFATIKINHTVLGLLGTLLTIGFLCFLQYDNMFQLGLKHHYKHIDHSRPQKSLGMKIGILASSPLFLLIVIGLALQILNFESASAVLKLLYYALQGGYIQLHAFFTDANILTADSVAAQCIGWLFYLLYTLPAIAFCGLGYYLGAKDRTLRSFFGLGNIGKKNIH